MNKDAKLLAEAYGQVQAGQQQKIAKIHSKDVWELNPPLKATESRWPDANLTSRGEMKQFPVTVEYLHLTRNEDGEFDAIDAEDSTRSTIINLPLPQGFNPKASSEEVLKALGYTVTEKDGQTNLNFGEGEEGSTLPDVNTVMKKDEAYNILAKHLGSQDLAGVQDLPNGIGEAYQKGYDDLGWGKNENPYKEGTLGYYLYNWGQYDQETNG